MSLLAETCALLGDTHAATALYRLLSPWAELCASDHPEGIRGSVARYLGLLAATMKRWDEAERHFERAVATNARIGVRPWLAHTTHDYACMLLARHHHGDHTRARELLDAAHASYRELGMDRYAAAAAATAQEAGTT